MIICRQRLFTFTRRRHIRSVCPTYLESYGKVASELKSKAITRMSPLDEFCSHYSCHIHSGPPPPPYLKPSSLNDRSYTYAYWKQGPASSVTASLPLSIYGAVYACIHVCLLAHIFVCPYRAKPVATCEAQGLSCEGLLL